MSCPQDGGRGFELFPGKEQMRKANEQIVGGRRGKSTPDFLNVLTHCNQAEDSRSSPGLLQKGRASGTHFHLLNPLNYHGNRVAPCPIINIACSGPYSTPMPVQDSADEAFERLNA
ncbi:hypothetical protein MHYP_G00273480 [Metynnis hypsauchen]